jgi:hypothetical protein
MLQSLVPAPTTAVGGDTSREYERGRLSMGER